MVERKISKDEYKQHLLREADDNTERKKDGDNRENRCALNLGTKEAPKQPAQNSPQHKQKAPRLQEQQGAQVIPHVADTQPLLESEEEADQHRGADEYRRLH